MSHKLASAASILLLAAVTGILILYTAGVFGATPANPSSIQGTFTFRAADSELLRLDVEPNGVAVVSFHGIVLEGTFTRSFTTQTSATYSLAINSASSGNPDHLSFQMQIPYNGLTGNLEGNWYLRFRNTDSEGTSSSAEADDVSIWQASQHPRIQETPYEIFDWLSLQANGTGLMLNTLTIPNDLTDEQLAESARPVAWSRDGSVLVIGC